MRALKIFGIVIGCIVVVLIAGVIALWLIVNPNDYKGRIEAAVRSSTGRNLALTGNIHLAVFPSIALELGPASLGNPPGFSSSQPFASLRRVSLSVRLLPLLHHQLEVGKVEIDGLDLRLLKNARGEGNWAMPAAKTPPAPQSPGSSAVALGGIGGVVVENSRVSYQDLVVSEVNLDIGRVGTGIPVPVRWNLLLSTSPGAKPIPLSGNARLEYGANSAHLAGLDARIDDSKVRGSAAVSNLATGAMNFDLSIDRIDLDRYLGAAKSAKTVPQAPVPEIAAAPSPPPTELPTSALKTLQLDGKLAIGSATLYGMKLSQVEVGLAANNGLLHITPASAKLYGGTSTGNVTLDARGAVPVLHLDESLAGIDVQPLLVDFMKFNRLSGRGNVTANVTARGNTTGTLMSSLNGHVATNITNGAIDGLDLWSAVNSAVSLAQKHALPAGGMGKSTRFDTFRASAELTNGIASTKDLDIASGDLHVTGQGTTNLVTEAVDYHVSATILKGPSAGTLASIPLLISGTLTNPTVRPDAQSLVKSLAKQQLQKQKGKIESKLKGMLKGLIH
jgi:AsmA protein